MLARRWYFAAPMLLLSLGAVLMVSIVVKPDYSATGHLQLIPPNAPANPQATTQARSNPWMDLGFQALGQAVIIRLSDKRVLEDLVKAGYTDNFTVTMDYRTPLFTVEAVGHTPEQAIGTAKRVMALVTEDVVAEQKQYGVIESNAISTLALDEGDNVTTVKSKVTRILVVAGGVGLLVTVGVTIIIDSILRRRAGGRRVLGSAEKTPAGSQLSRAVGFAKRRGRDNAATAADMTSTEILLLPWAGEKRRPPAVYRASANAAESGNGSGAANGSGNGSGSELAEQETTSLAAAEGDASSVSEATTILPWRQVHRDGRQESKRQR
jgi:hypothetical protein